MHCYVRRTCYIVAFRTSVKAQVIQADYDIFHKQHWITPYLKTQNDCNADVDADAEADTVNSINSVPV